MLTVDYTRLGVRSGDRLLDLGCGFGRHAYQAARLGAEVVAFAFVIELTFLKGRSKLAGYDVFSLLQYDK